MKDLVQSVSRCLCAAAFTVPLFGLASPALAQTEITPAASSVTASAHDGNVPGNTVDNSLATRWAANGDGQWLQLDLGSVRSVGSVKVAVYNGNTRRNRFELQASACCGTWTTVWSGESSGTTTAEELYDFADIDARWVRYLGHMSNVNTFNSVTEVSVFAASSSPTARPTPTPTPTPTPRPRPRPGAVTSLDVLTFNAWEHASQGVAAVASDIQTAGADVVGMQETNGIDAKAICAALGTDWSFVQGYSAGDYTILSRYPIVRRIGETLAAYGGIGATIELSPGQRVHLFNAHLNWTPYGPYQLHVDGMSPSAVVASETSVRMPGLNELLAMARPYIATTEPAFLTGDFNAPSDADYDPPVAWPESIACRNAGLTDSYRALHSSNPRKYAGQFSIDDPGITWTPLAWREPHGCYDRIDFVWHSNGEASPTFSSERTVGSSDHRVVLSTFKLSMPPRVSKASQPLPAHGSTGAPRHPLLTWVPGGGATAHQLYLGTTSPGSFVKTLTDSKYAASRLARGVRYYWRVDTVTASGTTTGDVWSFTTTSGPGLQPSRTTYTVSETVSVAFDGAASVTDWVGLYRKGDAYGVAAAALDWKYLNNSKSAPGAIVSSGSLTLTGQPAGSYVIRFFASDGYRLLDEVPLTVR